MTLPKIKACPICLDGGDPVLMTYEYGWNHVECLDCNLLGSGHGRQVDAIRAWNAPVAPTPVFTFSADAGAEASGPGAPHQPETP